MIVDFVSNFVTALTMYKIVVSCSCDDLYQFGFHKTTDRGNLYVPDFMHRLLTTDNQSALHFFSKLTYKCYQLKHGASL